MTTGTLHWSLETRIERATRADPSLDYCLWPYEAPALSNKDSWRGSALLFQSLHHAGLSRRALDVCDRIRQAAGAFQTVVGIKSAGGTLSWEFYFYDYARMNRRFGTADLAAALSDLVDWQAPLTGDRHPYFMFSIELDADHFEGRKPVTQIDLYIGNPGSHISSGICYGLTESGLEMRNFYFFFDTASEREAIEGKVTATPHAPADMDSKALLWPEVSPQVTVIANKRRNDGVYFSRIGVNDLVHLLGRLPVPAPLARFVEDNRSRLAHLMFDVGYDWRWTPQGPEVTKASWYVLL